MKREVEMDDYFRMKNIGSLSASSDGRFIAYSISNTYRDFKKGSRSMVYLKNLSDGTEREFGKKDSSNVQTAFSPDGHTLSYVSQKNSESFFNTVNTETLSEQSIAAKGKIISYKWVDNESLLFLLEIEPESGKDADNGDDGYFFEENDPVGRLFSFTFRGGFSIVDDKLQIWEFDCAGGSIAAVASDSHREGSWYNNYLISMKHDGSWKKVYQPERGQIALPFVSPDGKKVAFLESLWSDRGVTSGDVVMHDFSTGKTENLTASDPVSYSCVSWSGNDSFYSLSENMGTFELKDFSNGKKKVWSGKGSVFPGFAPSFVINRDKAFFVYSSSDLPPEIMGVDLRTGESQKVTKVNSDLEDLKTYPWETITWKGTDGLEIYGLFRSAGVKKPLVVYVHGGPTSSSKEIFLDRYSHLIPKGYSIFMPNYRGSTGKGRKYAELNRGDMGGMDFQDILAGINFLGEKGYIDPEKIGITGGSYGGFMTSWAITQSNIFKVGIGLFGISDWVSFHGTTNIAEWDAIQYGESPYVYEKFVKFSPLRYVENVKAKVLLMHGKEDPSVPIGQYFQFYRALKDHGKDVRFLIFPREGHGFQEKLHIKQSMVETLKMLQENL
ncbi:S9 family peptidase [Oxyplasma meridianum]|uniref:S9 family peptidase n=1 Tax=Oxyplasma meridianum TaxID=3073602 RepID=A0AAX4NHH9_9ARCH